MSFHNPSNAIDFLANHTTNPSSTLSDTAINAIKENYGEEDIPNWMEMDRTVLLALHSTIAINPNLTINPEDFDDVASYMWLEEGYILIALPNNRVALNVREMEYTFDN